MGVRLRCPPSSTDVQPEAQACSSDSCRLDENLPPANHDLPQDSNDLTSPIVCI